MEVILLERIRNLGALGDKVKVKSGFGRNYLVPQGKAIYATEANVAKFNARRAELEKVEAGKLGAAQERKKALDALQVITIAVRAGDEGKLFGSIGTREIAAAINKAGVPVEKSELHMPMGLLRQTGDYEVEIELHSDLSVMMKVSIIPEGGKHSDDE